MRVHTGRLGCVSVRLFALAAFALTLTACRQAAGTESSKLRFVVSLPDSGSEALDGRMLVLVSTDSTREPRFQVSDGDATQQAFGIDVDGLRPGETAVLDGAATGYPVRRLALLPPGDYWVQALLHKYETFHRSDGHVVKLPMDRGEGQQWNRAPGNLYSTPKRVISIPFHRGSVRPDEMETAIDTTRTEATTRCVKARDK